VKDLWFSVPHGQCFGFLGLNGAGKTSTLAMLTGEFPPTAGDAFLENHSIIAAQDKAKSRGAQAAAVFVTRAAQIRGLMGFCPQFDAIFDLLTGREHLELYARIKVHPRGPPCCWLLSVRAAGRAGRGY
jgi:ABC-type multidrug transport system ATPase subunit